jgi:hypothetical protein
MRLEGTWRVPATPCLGLASVVGPVQPRPFAVIFLLLTVFTACNLLWPLILQFSTDFSP